MTPDDFHPQAMLSNVFQALSYYCRHKVCKELPELFYYHKYLRLF